MCHLKAVSHIVSGVKGTLKHAGGTQHHCSLSQTQSLSGVPHRHRYSTHYPVAASTSKLAVFDQTQAMFLIHVLFAAPLRVLSHVFSVSW